MARILICYHSGEGQTERVVDRLGERLRALGVEVVSADAVEDPDPGGYDGVIVGDSIHVNRHSRQLVRWLTEHGDQLDAIPTAAFQVSLSSASSDDQRQADARRLLDQMLETTGLDPELVGLFAGALAYTRYGWLKRHLMQHIAEIDGNPTDASEDHEFTDWDAVDEFAVHAAAAFGLRS